MQLKQQLRAQPQLLGVLQLCDARGLAAQPAGPAAEVA